MKPFTTVTRAGATKYTTKENSIRHKGNKMYKISRELDKIYAILTKRERPLHSLCGY